MYRSGARQRDGVGRWRRAEGPQLTADDGQADCVGRREAVWAMLGERAPRAVREAAPHIACTAESAANAGRQRLHMAHHLRDDVPDRELVEEPVLAQTAG